MKRRTSSRERKWRIAILRGATKDDGFGTVADDPVPDLWRWAKKTDVQDGERVRAAQQGMEISSRFNVAADSLTRTLTSSDTLFCGEVRHAIVGIKELGAGRDLEIEITTSAAPYSPDQRR